MPNIKSAIKRVNTSKTKTLENTMIKSEYKTAVKNFLQTVEEGDKEVYDKLCKNQEKLFLTILKNLNLFNFNLNFFLVVLSSIFKWHFINLRKINPFSFHF